VFENEQQNYVDKSFKHDSLRLNIATLSVHTTWASTWFQTFILRQANEFKRELNLLWSLIIDL